MASASGHRTRRTTQNTQFTYSLSRRVHAVQPYPVLSPQGASILIYAHDDGVTVVWRGGRRFKPQPAAAQPANGHQNGKPSSEPQDSVMVLDSDDDDDTNQNASGTSSRPFVDNPQFEPHIEDDLDLGGVAHACPDVTQTLDLSLGFPVLHVATLPMTPCPADQAAWGGADILKEKMVFAVSCANRDVFLITLPLVPPSPLSKERPELRKGLLAAAAGNGKWGETLTLLAGQETSSDGLTMNLMHPKAQPSMERNKSKERSRSTSSNNAPRIVIAAHSGEASGVLRLWEVLVEAPHKDARVEPFQTEYLPKPFRSISFNPTHSSQLLCNASPDALRVYDYATPSMPEDQYEGPFPGQGSWILSLYAPFARYSTSRKPIVGAEWISRGQAVMALLADGQWGIWDIDGISPQGPVLGGKRASAERPRSVADFDVSGHLEGTSHLRNAGSRTSAGKSEFVPMSPQSRKDALGPVSSSGQLSKVRGGMTVTPLPTRVSTSADESVSLWYRNSDYVYAIPGVLKFWDAQKRKVGVDLNGIGKSPSARMVRMGELNAGLMGDECTAVSAIVRFAETGNTPTGGDNLPVDVLVRGDSRLVVVQQAEAAPGTKIGGVVGRRKRPHESAGDNSAIVVYPRPQVPNSVAFNLSSRSRSRLGGRDSVADGRRASSKLEFERPEESPPASRPGSGFSFYKSLGDAADAEPDVEQGDGEVDMLDIMEIDRELQALDGSRGRGRKKVLFDS